MLSVGLYIYSPISCWIVPLTVGLGTNLEYNHPLPFSLSLSPFLLCLFLFWFSLWAIQLLVLVFQAVSVVGYLFWHGSHRLE